MTTMHELREKNADAIRDMRRLLKAANIASKRLKMLNEDRENPKLVQRVVFSLNLCDRLKRKIHHD